MNNTAQNLEKLRKMTNEEKNRLYQIWTGGVPLAVIACEFRVGKMAIRKYADEHMWPERSTTQDSGNYNKATKGKPWLKFYKRNNENPLSVNQIRALIRAAYMTVDEVVELTGMLAEDVWEAAGGVFNLNLTGNRVRVWDFPRLEVGQWILCDYPATSELGSGIRSHKIPAKIRKIHPYFYECELPSGQVVCQHVTDAKKVSRA